MEETKVDNGALAKDDPGINDEEEYEENDMDKDVNSVVGSSTRWWKPSSGFRGSPSSVFVRIAKYILYT